MKSILNLIVLSGIVLLGACGMPDVEVSIAMDKDTYTMGETVTFEVNTTEPYDCGNWKIENASGSIVYSENGVDPSASSNISYTPTEAGEYRFTYFAAYECDGSGVVVGEYGKDYFDDSVPFTVTE
ncbi:MAG: hypothetical protein ACPGLV_12160 [Bacteroidia bacterium]